MTATPWVSSGANLVSRRRAGEARSRSPAGGWSTWISREVALMGRYADRRPKGMWADSSGAMRLNDLMSNWGEEQGLTKQQVLSALKENQYHENSESLRFQLTSQPAGDVTIRVFRRKDAMKSTPGDAGRVKLVPTPPSQPPPGVLKAKLKIATPMQERRGKDWQEADVREPKRGSSWAKSSGDDAWWTDRRSWRRGGQWSKSDWTYDDDRPGTKDRDDGAAKQRSASEPREESAADATDVSSAGAAKAAESAADGPGSPPDNPPGAHWTKYTDDGVLWWFYDGPKGKWWKQEADDKPQPWAEE